MNYSSRVAPLVLLFSFVVDAQPPDLELKGLKLGSDRAALIQPGWDCAKPKQPIADEVCFLRGTTLAGNEVRYISASYFNGRLLMLSAVMPVGSYSGIATALAEKYGTPEKERQVVQNAYGAKYDNERLTWTTVTGKMLFVQRSSVTDSTLILKAKDFDGAAASLKTGGRDPVKDL